MEKFYVVKDILGDYAIIESQQGESINISTFLLPENIEEGDVLVSTMPMQYEKYVE